MLWTLPVGWLVRLLGVDRLVCAVSTWLHSPDTAGRFVGLPRSPRRCPVPLSLSSGPSDALDRSGLYRLHGQ